MADEDESYDRLPLLPHRFRFVGYVLIFSGLGAAYLYFWGGRPTFFEVPVFAIATSYVETRWFVLAQTNLLDEMAIIFAVVGLLFIGFSREAYETRQLNNLRGRALLLSAYSTSIIWIILYLTIFGWPMIVVSATIFLLFLATYILTFQLLRRNFRRKSIKYRKNKERI